VPSSSRVPVGARPRSDRDGDLDGHPNWDPRTRRNQWLRAATHRRSSRRLEPGPVLRNLELPARLWREHHRGHRRINLKTAEWRERWHASLRYLLDRRQLVRILASDLVRNDRWRLRLLSAAAGRGARDVR